MAPVGSIVAVSVVVALVAALWLRARIRRRRRAREAESMFVLTTPGIELEQPYGGWDADASDSYTGHGLPVRPFLRPHGPPSTWGRLW